MYVKFKVLSIVGSPITRKSNTRALIEDFVNELSKNGIDLDHEIISLGRLEVKPCRGCLNCTYNKPCPIKDDLLEIKQKMIACDMLILGSPVYLNHVSAQMKALFDRLFTWCQNYPLLGKFSLSAVTSDNDGQKETAAYIEKMLAAYGTSSFGSIGNIEVFTPGFIPGRGLTKTHNQKLARKVSRIIREGKIPPSSFMTKELEHSKETAE